jgi:c-di-GMP-binding flagellar brake protein YcgR
MTQAHEKRRHARVPESLTIRAAHEGGVAFQTINLSAGGMFCTSPTYIAPMTKLSLTMEVPHSDAPAHIEGEAVVVRTEPEATAPAPRGGYRLALFFSRLADDDRRALQAYLSSRGR